MEAARYSEGVRHWGFEVRRDWDMTDGAEVALVLGRVRESRHTVRWTLVGLRRGTRRKEVQQVGSIAASCQEVVEELRRTCTLARVR